VSPERITDSGVLHWWDDTIGATDHEYPSNYRFNNDYTRVQLDWEKCPDHGRFGWEVGEESVILYYGEQYYGHQYPIGDGVLVVFDGDTIAHSIHRSHIR
jgi:hypothetical protein